MFQVYFDSEDYSQLETLLHVLSEKFLLVVQFKDEDISNLSDPFLIDLNNRLQSLVARVHKLWLQIIRFELFFGENKPFPKDIETEGVNCFEECDNIFTKLDDFVDEKKLNVHFKQFLGHHYSLGRIGEGNYLFH